MSFTTKEFPNRVFEALEEYDAALEVRARIMKRLEEKKRTGKVKVRCSVIKQKQIEELKQILEKVK